MAKNPRPVTQELPVGPEPVATRGYGWIADTHDKSAWPKAKALFGALHTTLPNAVSMEEFAEIKDQGGTSACVGFATAQAIFVRCKQMGTPIEFPSPGGIYTIARAVARTSPDQPLIDKGCMPADAMIGLSTWGAPSESAWPFGDVLTINNEPNFDELQSASQFVMTGHFPIDTFGPSLVNDVCQALAAGYPVEAGFQIDQAFEDYDGSGVLSAPDPKTLKGGHMLCVVGYRTTSTGHREFRFANSWGKTTWGDHGFGWGDESWLTDLGAADFNVITVAGR